MTPQDLEWHQERLETEYLRNKINAAEYRRGMKAMGFSDAMIDNILSDLDEAKTEKARQHY